MARRRWQADRREIVASRRGAARRRRLLLRGCATTRENARKQMRKEREKCQRWLPVASRRVTSRRVAFRYVTLRCVFPISCRVSRCVLAHRTWRVATSHCAPGERGAAAPLRPSKPPPGRPVCHPCRGDDAPPPPPAARYYRLPPRGCGASAYSHTTDPARSCSIYLPVPEPERDDDGLT